MTGTKLIKGAISIVDAAATKKVNDFNEPSFGKGPMGTLHGQRSDADGYKFFRITLFGPPLVKTVKGCTLKFESDSGDVSCSSDTKDIESIYSNSLKKGITSFEIYLDKDLHQSLKKPFTSVTITIPKKYIGKHIYSFDIQSKKLMKLVNGK